MSRKNPFKSSLILTVVAAAVGTTSYFVLHGHQEKEDKAKDHAMLLFPDVERAKIVEVNFENASGAYHLKKKAQPADQWSVSAAKSFDADKGSVEGMLSTIISSKKDSTLNSTDLGSLGLQPAKYKLSVSTGAGGTQKELLVGEDTPVDYYVYAKWSDKPEIFLTSRSLRFALDKKLTELRNKKIFPQTSLLELSKVEIKTLAHDKVNSDNLVFEKDENGKWKSTGKVKTSIQTPELEKFMKNFNDLSVVGFASEDPADRPKLGFKNPVAKLVLTPVKNKSGAEAEPTVWLLAMSQEKKKDAEDDKSDDKVKDKAKKAVTTTKYYFAREGDDSTFEVAETFRDHFKTDLMNFRSREVLNVTRANITGLSVTDGTTNIDFQKDSGNKWLMKAQTLKGPVEGPAKSDVVESLLTTLTGLKVKNFLDNENQAGLGLKKPSRVIEMRGKKDGKDQNLATLFIGKKMGKTSAVARADGMEAPAEIEINVDDGVSVDPNRYLAAPAPTKETPTSTLGGSKKVKLEATVSSIKEIKKLPAAITKPGMKYTAEITMESGSKIVIEFASDKAPYTVSNFLHLARNHFYDGVKFHRVIKDFVAQGGDPTGTGAGGPGYKFDNEDNDLKHERGSISMAHAGRNTNGSQFFLVLKPQPHLDGIHTVYGKVVEGLDAMDLIKQGDAMKKVEVFEEKL